MIRVLQMIGSLGVGGSQTMMMNVYRNIDRSRIQFDFVIDHPDGRAFAEEIESLGGRIYEMPGFHGSNFREIQRDWNNFFYVHPEYRVLHSHVRSYASLYLPVASRHGVKTIIHSHSTSSGTGIKAAVKTALQKPLKDQADILIACSSEAGRWLYGEKACQGSNYVFLPNAVDTKLYAPDEAVRAKYRGELGVEDKYVVGHVGRLHPAKNHGFLLAAFAELKKRRPDAVLLLVGEGELRGPIEEKIRALNLDGSVIMTGLRKDVPQLLQAMDVFAYPSAWEGMPMTVIEAQAAGLPCYISDRITRDVNVSRLVNVLPVDSIAPWVDALASPSKKEDVRGDIIRAGFDIGASVDTLSRIYTELWQQSIEEERG